MPEINYYGDKAFINKDPSKPKITPGNSYNDSNEYDYWDHIDYIIDLAAEKGIYMAMVPIWGSTAISIKNNKKWTTNYATWLAPRFKNHPGNDWVLVMESL